MFAKRKDYLINKGRKHGGEFFIEHEVCLGDLRHE